jgi:hypothetical protein
MEQSIERIESLERFRCLTIPRVAFERTPDERTLCENYHKIVRAPGRGGAFFESV